MGTGRQSDGRELQNEKLEILDSWLEWPVIPLQVGCPNDA